MKTEEDIQKLLSVPSDHKEPIEEKTKLDNKRRWFEQFIKEAEARKNHPNSGSNSINETSNYTIQSIELSDTRAPLSSFSLNTINDTSLSSTSSMEADVQQKEKKISKIPVLSREKSNVSISTIGLSRTNSISSLFKELGKHLEGERIKRIYKDKRKNTMDVVLSEKDPFLDDIADNRKKPAISFRNCVRVANVTEEEIFLLKDASPKKPMILGNKAN